MDHLRADRLRIVISYTLKPSDAQSEGLDASMRRISDAHVEAVAEPPGFDLGVTVGGPRNCEAVAVCGSSRLVLGDVQWAR